MSKIYFEQTHPAYGLHSSAMHTVAQFAGVPVESVARSLSAKINDSRSAVRKSVMGPSSTTRERALRTVARYAGVSVEQVIGVLRQSSDEANVQRAHRKAA